MRYSQPFASVECPKSGRLDSNHSWRFDGDDPYLLCVYCGERRDTLTGRALSPFPPTSKEDRDG